MQLNEEDQYKILFDEQDGAATNLESSFPDIFADLHLPIETGPIRKSSRLSTRLTPAESPSNAGEGQNEADLFKKVCQTEPDENDVQPLMFTCLTEKEAFQLYMHENELTPKNFIGWKKGTFLTTEADWYSPPSNVVSLGTPVEYFSKYFTDNLFRLMVEQTNLYGLYENPNFPATNIHEVKQMFGIMIMLGNLGFPRLRLYWDSMFRIPLIADTMQINRFFKLRQTLHVTGREMPQNAASDKLWKVRPIYDSIRSRCLELQLERDLCIDEQMVPFKGKFSIKQYISSKPSPWGIKIFLLCGRSGTVLDFLIYQGATTEIDYFFTKFGLGAGTVMQLCQRINVQNCRIYFDNYFTSFHLLEWLHKRNIFAVGTARVDRFQKPPFKKDNEMKAEPRGTHEEVIANEGKVILTKWYDNKAVICASNFVSAGTMQTCKRWDKREKKFLDIPRPDAIKLYNKSMGGVDKLDFLISIYRIFIRARKWTLRMIDHSVDIAITNSWLEYMKDAQKLNLPKKEKLDLIHFRQHVAQALILCNQNRGKKRGRPTSVESSPCPSPSPSRPRLNTEQRPIKDVRHDRIDHLPEFDVSRDGQRCKYGKCQMKTHFYCEKCRVHLCITKKRNCFKSFHS